MHTVKNLADALSWSTTNRSALIALATVIVAYPVSYWVPQLFPRILRRRSLSERDVAIWSVILARLWGAAALGVPASLIALCVLPRYPNRLGVNLSHAGVSIVVALAVWIFIWSGYTLFARIWPRFFTGYPEIDTDSWTSGLILLNTASWIIYLIPYEFVFRGFLLFPLASAFGGTVAMLISIGHYSFAHLVKEPQEQVSTIFGGVLFSCLALATSSILGPILIHCFLAPVTEIFAIRNSRCYPPRRPR